MYGVPSFPKSEVGFNEPLTFTKIFVVSFGSSAFRFICEKFLPGKKLFPTGLLPSTLPDGPNI